LAQTASSRQCSTTSAIEGEADGRWTQPAPSGLTLKEPLALLPVAKNDHCGFASLFCARRTSSARCSAACCSALNRWASAVRRASSVRCCASVCSSTNKAIELAHDTPPAENTGTSTPAIPAIERSIATSQDVISHRGSAASSFMGNKSYPSRVWSSRR
jgi:hypothetical protein